MIQREIEFTSFADTLLIFDCCEAGGAADASWARLHKFEQRHHMSGRATKLEILGACNASDTTPSEGPNTFTKRLTKYLGSIQHSTSVYNTDDIHTHLYKKHRKGRLDVEPFRINLTPNSIPIVLEPTWSRR